jgi:hypothetical protein
MCLFDLLYYIKAFHEKKNFFKRVLNLSKFFQNILGWELKTELSPSELELLRKKMNISQDWAKLGMKLQFHSGERYVNS